MKIFNKNSCMLSTILLVIYSLLSFAGCQKEVVLNKQNGADKANVINNNSTKTIGGNQMTENVAKKEANAVTVNIKTDSGHSIPEGFSGFNTNTPQQGWNFDHPVFISETQYVKPGGLRFVAGTLSDPFNWKTGLYEEEWIDQFVEDGGNKNWFINSGKKLIGKGGAHLSKFYDLLGQVGGKLTICVNAYTDTPESAADLARFCKDNHIQVECYQLCNEPNFYNTNASGHMFFNGGTDYAAKMKPYADAIRSVDANAIIGLSFGWDNWGEFGKQILAYPEKYWDVATYHSYKPHTGKPDTFEKAVNRADKGLQAAGSRVAVEEHMTGQPECASMMITELGIWNKELDNIYGDLYLTEYIMRMTEHPEMKYVYVHVLNTGAFEPVNDYGDDVKAAGERGEVLDLSNREIKVKRSTQGEALRIINEAINKSTYSWDVSVSSDNLPPQLYSRAYKGWNGKNYLLINNRSSGTYDVTVKMGGNIVTSPIKNEYIWAKKPNQISILNKSSETANPVQIMPYSITRLEWNAESMPVPQASRIYNIAVGDGNAELKWWKRDTAKGYKIKYGLQPGVYEQVVDAGDVTSYNLTGLETDRKYYFVVCVYNDSGESEMSNEVDALIAAPPIPKMRAVFAQEKSVKVEWQSVPYAKGYKVYYGESSRNYIASIEVGNVCGTVIRGLQNDKKYYFTVTALNGKGESGRSEELSTTPKSGLPFPARNLSAQYKDDAILLTWDHSLASPADSYIIERSTSPRSGYSVIAQNITGISYSDKVIQKDSLYYYRLTGVNAKGKSNYTSNIATVK